MLEEQRGAKKQHLVFLEQPACAKKNPGSIIIARNIKSLFCISTDLTWVIY